MENVNRSNLAVLEPGFDLERESIEAQEAINAHVEMSKSEFQDRFNDIVVAYNQQYGPKPYDWATDDIDYDLITETAEDTYKAPLFPKIYDWETDDLEYDLANDETDLFGLYVPTTEADIAELPADKTGLFADYEPTGELGKVELLEPEQESRIVELFKRPDRSADLQIPERRFNFKAPVKRIVGRVAVAAAVIAAGIAGSYFNGERTVDIKTAQSAAVSPLDVPEVPKLNLTPDAVQQPTTTLRKAEPARPAVTSRPKTTELQPTTTLPAPEMVNRFECPDVSQLAKTYGVTEEVLSDTMEYLVNNHKLTEKGAKHLTANFIAESKINPSAVGDGGRALRLAQWHKNRRPANFQIDRRWQIDYAISEMPTSGGVHLIAALRDANASDAQIQRGLKQWERYSKEAGRYQIARVLLNQASCTVHLVPASS